MKVVDELPHSVREIEHTFIPMPDGARLAARIWLPASADLEPVPAVLEYIPYRKRDFTARRDSIIHGYFAGHGYAAVRVDLRGSGDSDGVLTDEYLPQELDDGLQVLRWIARQPWCDGSVGMIGKSWGGFNALQIAALQPPELEAIVTVCSSDDRYTDDVHYMGGCLLGDNLSWASVMFAYNSLPPDPALVGERWRDMWLERLDGGGLWLAKWLRHQRRDEYWRHGSVSEDYGAVACPVFAVSGWADGYSNTVFRLLSNLQVPRRGLIGPWSHLYPHEGTPGPAIGFLQECLRWWDRWLRGRRNGIEDEPMLRVWMQDSIEPSAQYDHRPGRWVAETHWPSPRVEPLRYALGYQVLAPPPARPAERRMTIQSPLTVGLFAGKWCSFAATPDLPHDQRQEDGGALVFDTEPLNRTVEVLGQPTVDLELESDRPVAMVAVRLSDVAPDDKATRVTYGILNLLHLHGHEDPRPLVPGRRYRVRVALNDVAQRFPRGHRIRLSISTSYWPLAWPPPHPVRLTVHTGHSALVLPERPPSPEDDLLRPFGEAEGAAPTPTVLLQPTQSTWRVIRDLASDVSTLEVLRDEGVQWLENADLEVERRTSEWYSFRGDDFDTVRGEVLSTWGLARGDHRVRTITRTVLTSTPTHFRIRADLDAYEADKRVFVRSWDEEIERDCM
ncbi:MAG: CocE/NonD family hydrolase [Myxococcota bacterium]